MAPPTVRFGDLLVAEYNLPTDLTVTKTDTDGQQLLVVQARLWIWDPNSLSWVRWTGTGGAAGEQLQARQVLSNTTLTTLIAAQGAGIKIFLTHIKTTNSGTNGNYISISDPTSGVLWDTYAAAQGGGSAEDLTAFSLRFAANQPLQVQLGSTPTAGDVRVTVVATVSQ